MINVAVAGILGRMGSAVAQLTNEDDDLNLAGGIVRPGSDATRSNLERANISVVESADEILPVVDVLIDFTNQDASVSIASACLRHGVAFVSGTTGFADADMAELRRISEEIPVFHAANLSVGVTAILDLLPLLAQRLGGYDIEVLESHHRWKADAPSGTALKLVDALLDESEGESSTRCVMGRSGLAQRTDNEIGIHAVRAGGNPGEHHVVFASEDEQVTVSHRSFSRSAYTRGAIRAVKFVNGKQNGFFTTADLVG